MFSQTGLVEAVLEKEGFFPSIAQVLTAQPAAIL
jgi:hypothetical protein